MSNRESAIEQLCTARRYTEELLRHVTPEEWFRQPSEGVTHIGWQVGHLAVAEYGLALKRVRGDKPGDDQLISPDYRKLFGKGSLPDANPATYPAVDEIRAVFDRVHQHAVDELHQLPEEMLKQPTDPSHPMFTTRLGALHWCAQHEFIHAGQIALLRRLFGNEPLR